MSEILTYEQMKERYDGEWVLVGAPELTEMDEVIRGQVLAHSPDRDEVYRKVLELSPKSAATLCFKTLPEDAAVIL